MPRLILTSTRTEWLQERENGIGASEAAVVMGVSPWTTAKQLWDRKKGYAPEQAETPAMRRGTELEPLVLRLFSEAHPEYTVEPNAELYAHSTHDFIRATPDAFLEGENGGVEAKTGRDFTEVPVYYFWQVQHQMLVMDWDFVWVALMPNNGGFRSFLVQRDQESIDILVGRLTVFWESLKESRAVDLDPALIEERRGLIEAQQAIKARIDTIDAELKEQLGDAETGLVDGEVAVTWNVSSRTTFDSKKFKAENPTIYNAYTITKPVRTFLVKDK